MGVQQKNKIKAQLKQNNKNRKKHNKHKTKTHMKKKLYSMSKDDRIYISFLPAKQLSLK